jgi:hypothetical protein
MQGRDTFPLSGARCPTAVPTGPAPWQGPPRPLPPRLHQRLRIPQHPPSKLASNRCCAKVDFLCQHSVAPTARSSARIAGSAGSMAACSSRRKARTSGGTSAAPSAGAPSAGAPSAAVPLAGAGGAGAAGGAAGGARAAIAAGVRAGTGGRPLASTEAVPGRLTRPLTAAWRAKGVARGRPSCVIYQGREIAGESRLIKAKIDTSLSRPGPGQRPRHAARAAAHRAARLAPAGAPSAHSRSAVRARPEAPVVPLRAVARLTNARRRGRRRGGRKFAVSASWGDDRGRGRRQGNAPARARSRSAWEVGAKCSQRGRGAIVSDARCALFVGVWEGGRSGGTTQPGGRAPWEEGGGRAAGALTRGKGNVQRGRARRRGARRGHAPQRVARARRVQQNAWASGAVSGCGGGAAGPPAPSRPGDARRGGGAGGGGRPRKEVVDSGVL